MSVNPFGRSFSHPSPLYESEVARPPVIVPRFAQQVDAHLLGNILNIPDYPLMMWIVGPPGMGKTWQLRRHLKAQGFNVLSVSSADLESKEAGEPAKLLQRRYIEAGASLNKGKPAALVVDDIDTTVGEWETHTGTVNHQGILAFLMHIADSPTMIESVGSVARVPVFFTGNDSSRLYAPLVRHGRTVKFHWIPTYQEKVLIVQSILGAQGVDTQEIGRLVETYPNESISFFSQLAVEKAVSAVSIAASLNGEIFKSLIMGDDSLVSQFKASIRRAQMGTDWISVTESF